MPSYGKDRERYYISRIRALMVRKPDISIKEIQQTLMAHPVDPLKLHQDYINKLRKKILVERTKRLDTYTVRVHLAELEDETLDLKQRLWSIIQSKHTDAKDKIKAIKELRDSSHKLFDAMMDAGVFERQLGKLKTEDQLSDEDKDFVTNALNHAFPKRTDSKNNIEKSD